MKVDIHPEYHTDVKITCACGHTVTAGSTSDSMSIELCSNCHPFYTGKQKIVDTARRVEKFEARVSKKADAVMDHKAKAAKKAERAKKKAEKKAKSEN